MNAMTLILAVLTAAQAAAFKAARAPAKGDWEKALLRISGAESRKDALDRLDNLDNETLLDRAEAAFKAHPAVLSGGRGGRELSDALKGARLKNPLEASVRLRSFLELALQAPSSEHADQARYDRLLRELGAAADVRKDPESAAAGYLDPFDRALLRLYRKKAYDQGLRRAAEALGKPRPDLDAAARALSELKLLALKTAQGLDAEKLSDRELDALALAHLEASGKRRLASGLRAALSAPRARTVRADLRKALKATLASIRGRRNEIEGHATITPNWKAADALGALRALAAEPSAQAGVAYDNAVVGMRVDLEAEPPLAGWSKFNTKLNTVKAVTPPKPRRAEPPAPPSALKPADKPSLTSDPLFWVAVGLGVAGIAAAPFGGLFVAAGAAAIGLGVGYIVGKMLA